MNDRLPWRLFGLIYAHPHPKSADTTVIKNKAGLPLPTDFTGEPAQAFLIDKAEQDKRLKTMQQVCLACHSQTWVEGHFKRLDHTIQTTEPDDPGGHAGDDGGLGTGPGPGIGPEGQPL